MIDLDNPITQRQFADLVGVSEAAVSNMVSRCVIIPGQSGGAWLKDYCAHLREQAAGRAAAGDLDLATERARVAKEQADKLAMQNAVTRKELAPVFLIEEVLAKAGARAARIIDTIPGLIRRREPSLSADTLAAIAREIAKVRNIASAISLAQLREEQPEDDTGADPDAPEPEAA